MLMVFGVFDCKAAAYSNPVFLVSRGIALRMFSDVVAGKDSPLSAHPADFSLHQLGTFDPNSGELFSEDKPIFIVSASDVVQQLAPGDGPDLSEASSSFVKGLRKEVKG